MHMYRFKINPAQLNDPSWERNEPRNGFVCASSELNARCTLNNVNPNAVEVKDKHQRIVAPYMNPELVYFEEVTDVEEGNFFEGQVVFID